MAAQALYAPQLNGDTLMNKITLNELDRKLLQSVSIPDLALGALPPAKLLQSNSPELLDRPEADDNIFVAGAVAGGWVLPTAGGDGRVFMPVPPGFDFGVIAFTQRWVEGELDSDGKFQTVGEPYAEKPPTARWRPDPDRPGRRSTRPITASWCASCLASSWRPRRPGKSAITSAGRPR